MSMYRQSNPRIIAVIATAIIFLLFLLAGCKSKQQVVTEYMCSDSLEVKEVAAVRSTAKATSSTSSLEQMLSSMSLNIDSIVITMPSEWSDNYYGESLAYGSAVSPGSPHDHPPDVGMAEGLTYGDTCPAQGMAVTPFKTAIIPKPPPARISPNNTRHINVPYQGQQGKIVISGIRLNQQTATAAANITASSDTISEVHTDYVEQTAVSSQSVKAVEGKPRSKNVWQYFVIATSVIIAIIILMRKFHILNMIKRIIKSFFS